MDNIVLVFLQRGRNALSNKSRAVDDDAQLRFALFRLEIGGIVSPDPKSLDGKLRSTCLQPEQDMMQRLLYHIT